MLSPDIIELNGGGTQRAHFITFRIFAERFGNFHNQRRVVISDQKYGGLSGVANT